jgi:hypothetical protein
MSFCSRSMLVLAFWGVPVAAFACTSAGAASYADVTQIYVSTDELTVPVAIHADTTLAAGDCPQERDLRVWQQGTAMSGAQCVYSPSGKPSGEICCPTTFATDDPSARIFARLLAVLERDRFYDVAAERTANSTQRGAVIEIAVIRCAPLPDASIIGGSEYAAFAELPIPSSLTTVLHIVVPLGTKPDTALAPDVLRVLDDVTNAIYQSKWYGQDIY